MLRRALESSLIRLLAAVTGLAAIVGAFHVSQPWFALLAVGGSLVVVLVLVLTAMDVVEFFSRRGETVSEKRSRRRRRSMANEPPHQGPVLKSKDQTGGVVNQINYPPAPQRTVRKGIVFGQGSKGNTTIGNKIHGFDVAIDDQGEDNKHIENEID